MMSKPIKALVHANGDQQSANSNETTLRAPLAGSTVSSLHRVKGLDNEQMSIFYFPDLKVWVAGQFYLHFQLFYLPKKDTPHSLPTECVASVVSNEFTVFPVKEFPGVYESTPLSKHLKAQGLFISIRNKDRLKASKEDSGAAVESENSDDPPISESPPFEPRS
ncbi:hypothetical protein GGI10_001917 [Coemansia sp. RSA 2530]|nr:hypothetical protein GGI10_001917 [Coemansia sp. RSA 2530]